VVAVQPLITEPPASSTERFLIQNKPPTQCDGMYARRTVVESVTVDKGDRLQGKHKRCGFLC